jgi:putative transposase
MLRKRYKPEEIVAKVRQVDVLVSQGQPVAAAVRSIGVTEVTYYRRLQKSSSPHSPRGRLRNPGQLRRPR